MLEQGVLTYLAPGKYVSRAQEIQSVKAEKSISIDSDGNLKVAAKNDQLDLCESGSELTLRQAWFRRSLSPTAGIPSQVALTQIIAADRQLFTLAANNLLGDLQGAPGRAKPLDLQIDALATDHDVVQYLTHLPMPSSSNPNKRSNEGKNGGKGKGKDKDKAKKGKGKEKGGIQIPEGTVTSIDKKPLCFSFNVGTCKYKVSKKGRCGRGFHMCWWKHCGGDHAGHECTKARA